MGAEESRNCFVVTYRIDGKDAFGMDRNAISVNVVDDNLLVYNRTLFSAEKFEEQLTLRDMVSLIDSSSEGERLEELKTLESSLDDYAISSRLFQSENNINDPKALEHAITYYCTTVLSLNAITFLELTPASRKELSKFIPSLKHGGIETDADEEIPSGGDNNEDGEALPNTAILCDPVLDPVNGVPIEDLAAGEVLYCKLREGSVFYNLMEKISPDFDGIVTGDVMGVSVNELGTAAVEVILSEDVTGTIKVPANVRLKMASDSDITITAPQNLLVKVIFAVLGVIFFLCLMAILLHNPA